MTYTNEDFEIDIEWLMQNSIDEQDAKDLIRYVIKKSGGKIDEGY